MPQTPSSIYHEVTDEVRAQAVQILQQSLFGAIATINPDTQHPLCTRVGLGVTAKNAPMIFVSELSPHTKALNANPHCSLLVGAVTKGDPLTNPRLTLNCGTEKIGRDHAKWSEMLATYLKTHPKAKIYAELTDFHFFILNVASATYVAGFGRAFKLKSSDFGLEL